MGFCIYKHNQRQANGKISLECLGKFGQCKLRIEGKSALKVDPA